MPPKLGAVLTVLGVEANPEEFTAVESILGGSFSVLSDIRQNPDERIDATDLSGPEVSEWLARLPIEQNSEVHVAWIADRIGARMSYETLTANIDDLWFPGMDDIVSVLYSDSSLRVLVIDHEELITLSSIKFPRPLAGNHKAVISKEFWYERQLSAHRLRQPQRFYQFRCEISADLSSPEPCRQSGCSALGRPPLRSQ